ncbi:MAG: hypothetical protein J6Z36_02105, partial [Clostridia bacterium]|nr:hypothetical protein [Clostridia bacterium]
VCATPQELVEIYLTAPDNTAEYDVSFTVDGREYGGDMSYDNVYARYFYSRTLAAVSAPTLEITLSQGESQTKTLSAKRVKSGAELPMSAIIEKSVEQRKEFFDEKTVNGEFTGEIYLRLLYEEKCYYYIEVISGDSARYFLSDALTGEILAEREK